MQGVGVEDWLSIFIFVLGVHGRITGAGGKEVEFQYRAAERSFLYDAVCV